jgi:hypothetical protein
MLTKLRTENDVSREGRCDMSAGGTVIHEL